MVCNQDVLRLEIPVVDTNGVAIHDCVQDLQKSTSGKKIITDKVASFRDAGEQVAFGTKFNDHKGAVKAIHDANQRHHIGVTAGQVVELDLPLLELALSGVESELVEGLHGVGDVGVNVDGGVDDSIGAHAQDAGELQAVCEQQAQPVFGLAASDHWR